MTYLQRMVKPVKRRAASLEVVKNLIKGVAYIKQQKQVANSDRLAKFMQREFGLKYGETQREAQRAVEDNLLVSYKAVGTKGSKAGVEQEGFKLPDEESPVVDDGHDWYCFECHKPGEVLTCSDCWRVYHTTCTEEEWGAGVKFTCLVCKDVESGRKKNGLNKKYLNRLLGYTILRLKEKTKELHRVVVKDEEESQWRRYVYRPRDLNSMEQELTKRKYHSIEEFLADAKTILHNVILAFGEFSGMAELARIMIKDCKYDLDELRQCPSCYYMSNAKPKDWFCQICDPPHELVYAKQKGYSFWPAKVIRVFDDKYDVRFFGGYHQRAVVAKNYVKPITTGVRDLAIKRTSGFVKACEELQRHQRRLEESAGKTTTEDESEDTDEDSDEDEEDGEEEGEDTREVSSTSVMSSKQVPTPEDSNLVTSSEDKVTGGNLKVTTTSGHPPSSKKSAEAKPVKTSSKHSQTDPNTSTGCSCEAHYNKIFSDFKERFRNDHKEEKDKALKELSDRLHKDFEEDKQQAVSRAMANMQREMERVRRQTEEKCKEQYMEEMKKLAQKHKESISATKKKQWCFNCEEEAMYHCCWNTSYCSIKCQQEHWHKEHKRVCRRRR